MNIDPGDAAIERITSWQAMQEAVYERAAAEIWERLNAREKNDARMSETPAEKALRQHRKL